MPTRKTELGDLPERAIQFGTGALLRGLIDAILDDANRAGRFQGRVVAVGSTGSGREATLNRHGGRFTLRVEGMDGRARVREKQVVTSISRALSAPKQWDTVLECARNPTLEVVFSNTTEIGIELHPDDGDSTAAVPRSFPAKLTRFLEARARAFDYAPHKGIVVIPCELIERNGDTLRNLVLSLARSWHLGDRFTRWVTESVRFCNTLVDRIVTGDALHTVCEPYRLLVIEGDAALQARLGFARPEFGVVVTSDVSPYRERKVRILNGGHTTVVSLALIAGCTTVREAVEHRQIGRYLKKVLLEEIVPTVPAEGAEPFAREVLERFANPFIAHRLRDITAQGGAKMRVRVIPSIVAYTEREGRPPARLALGFAAYLLFTRNDSYSRNDDGSERRPDQVGDHIRNVWKAMSASANATPAFVRAICADVTLWGRDLNALPGFSDLVIRQLESAQRDSVLWELDALEVNEHLSPPVTRREALT